MTDGVVSFVALGAFAVLTLADICLAWQQRSDLPEGENPWSGRSPFGQLNLWRRERRTEEGRRRLGLHSVLAVGRGLALVVWLVFFTRAFL